VGTAEGSVNVIAFLRAISEGAGSAHGGCAAQGVSNSVTVSGERSYVARIQVRARSAVIGPTRSRGLTLVVKARGATIHTNEVLLEEI
jgi:hypothetical protein